MKHRILIFSDSRGQHKATFSSKLIFTEKLKKYFEQKNVKVDLMLCPFRWTSTIDFIQCIQENIIKESDYDIIILYTGVVEYSPRPLSNLKNVLELGNDKITISKLLTPKSKMVNCKQKFMTKWIGDELLNKNKEYKIQYMNERTKSLISLEIFEKKVIPFLQKLNHKLLYINSNRICPNWEGNYIKKNPIGRPNNINVIEKYSLLTRNKFSNYIDLMKWTDLEVKKYTIDNMHLTFEGSEYLFQEIIKNKLFDIYRDER